MSSDGRGYMALSISLFILSAVGLFLLVTNLNRLVWMSVGLLLLVIGPLPGIMFLGRARDQREADIREKGIDAKAKLIEWWMIGETNPTLEMEKACKFELEVMMEGKPSYTVKFRQIVPFRVYTQLSRGMILPVKVHPEKPE